MLRLRGSVTPEHTLARMGAERLWDLIHNRQHVKALGAMTGGQAVQQVRAGLEAIYVSGWQTAADANVSGETYPDQSLYPYNSLPRLVERINQALQRQDQIDHAEGKNGRHWFAPIVADGESGFGGKLNVFELMKGMIRAGAAGVHFEDQLSSEKKCGHMGGKVLVPTQEAVQNLTAARLASDILDVPSIIIARTDANSANLLRSDVDPRDQKFITGKRTDEGFYRVDHCLDQAIDRALSYAPYADMIWCETSTPDLGEAREFAQAVHEEYPEQLLAYNCSPSFNWKKALDDDEIARFQRELGEMGYKFQFVTLAGFHSLNYGMFDLASGYEERGMSAYTELQEAEFDRQQDGFTAIRHQHEVGAGYFDEVSMVVSSGTSSTTAMEGSTEEEQFVEAES